MARIPVRIAPVSIIARCYADLVESIERSTALAEETKESYLNASTKALTWVLDGSKFVWDGDELLIPSRSRHGGRYRVNGTCECEAGQDQRVCWHRAARKLVVLIQQATTDQPPVANHDDHLPPDFLCLHCGSVMTPARTPGGEDCFTCINPRCTWTIHAEAAVAFA